MQLTKLELCIASALALMAWTVAEFLPQSKLLIQIIAGFQSISCILISSLFLIRTGFFVSSWPYAIYGSIWFLFLDLMLGNYVAPDQFAVRVGFAASLFILMSIIFSCLPMLKLTWLRVKPRSLHGLLSIYSYRYIAFFAPLLVQGVIASSIGVSQIVLLFGGRSGGLTFWGSPIFPNSISTLLTPLFLIFTFTPALVTKSLFFDRIFLKSPLNCFIFLIPLLSSFASGSRNVFLASFVPVLLVLLSYSSAKIKILLIVLALIVIPVAFQYQVSNRGMINPATLEINYSQKVIGGASILSAHRDNNVDIFASAFLSRETGLLTGSNYNDIMVATLQFIPRAIFPFKPQSDRINYETGNMNFDEGHLSRFSDSLNTTASLSLSIAGDFFYAGGWIGLFFGSMVYAVILNLINRLFSLIRATFVDFECVALSSYLCFIALFSFRAYGATTVYITPFLYIFVILLVSSRIRVFCSGKSPSSESCTRLKPYISFNSPKSKLRK